MAVELTDTTARFNGTGVQSIYATRIYANDDDQIDVYVDGVRKTLGDDYVLNGLGAAAGISIVGTFVLNAKVFVQRDTPIKQEVDTQNNETILEDVLDIGFDKLTLMMQERRGETARAILFPLGELGMTLPPVAQRIGGSKKIIAIDQGTGAVSVEALGEAYRGNTGPANSTYKTLADLKNAPVTNGTYSLLTAGGRTEYAYVPGDFTGLADDAFVVKLNSTAITVGALIATGSITPAVFGASVGIADNGPAFGRMLVACRYLAVTYAIPPRITFLSGFYRYSGLDQSGVALNWAVQGLHLDAQPGVVLIHTGTGIAFDVDGGATGAGVACMKITGGMVIRGNTNTTDGMRNRAVHHSAFDVEIQSVSAAALRTNWVVCNEYWIRCSPAYRPIFNPVPTSGLFLSERAVGEKTSRCNFYNPLLEGINGYGIYLNSAIINTFLGGTSESNAGGIYVDPASSANIIDGLDMEANTVVDVFCLGAYNTFRNCLSDFASSFSGTMNNVDGGLWNAVTDAGEHNTFDRINYASAGGAFLRNGTVGVYRNIRNASGTFEPDQIKRPQKLVVLGNDPGGTGILSSWASDVAGGSATDWYDYKYGAGTKRIFGGPGGDRFAHGSAGTSLNGVALIARRALPAAAADPATTMALANALRQYLIDHGQCS
jgi:hypothetical protein